MSAEATSERVPPASLVTLAATVFFCVYGGYFLSFLFTLGLPSEAPFRVMDSEIAALTQATLDCPVVVWPIIYAIATVWLCWQSWLSSRRWLLAVFNLMVAAFALLWMWLLYMGIAVLPGVKLIGLLENA